MLILYKSHRGISVCILGLATMSGNDESASTLEYMLSGTLRLLWPCPLMLGA
jgi:hypothetical protein